MNTKYAPVALFVYNRPFHTARTLAALAANPLAEETDLVIYADGSKSDVHAVTVTETRRVARAATGFRSVRIVERQENLGLARSITSGVAEICQDAGRAIVVEDDLLVAPRFLEFLNLALDRYKDDERVFQVSGYAFPISEPCISHFLPIISCWGWATWERAWAHYDPAMTGFERLSFDLQRRRRFNLGDAYDYWGMACNQREGRIDSWGIRWQMSLFDRDGLVLYPPGSLVQNTGVDSSGTHGSGQAELQRPLVQVAHGQDWRWPSASSIDFAAYERVKALLRAQQPSSARATLDRFFRCVLSRQTRAALKSMLKPRQTN